MIVAGEAEDLSLYNDDDDGYSMNDEEWFTDSSTDETAPSTLLSQEKEMMDTSQESQDVPNQHVSSLLHAASPKREHKTRNEHGFP
jgi:hypothetical protein